MLPISARLGYKSATEILEMSDALVKSREAADESASSFLGLGESLNDPKTSLSDWIKELEESAIALREFRKNSEEAGRKGLDEGLVASLQAAGEEGAIRMAELADASDEEITRANRAFRRGERQLGLYVDAFGGVPEVVATDVRLTGLEDAKTALSIFAKSITSNPIVQQVVVVGPDGKKVKGRVGTDSSLEGLLGAAGSADGSTVPSGGAYRDRYPYLLAPGEEVISNRFGQADRNRPLLKAINAGVDPGLAFAQSRPAYSGGMGGGGSVGTVKLSRDDLDYIAGSLAQARPLYGAVSVQPHNYSEFTQQMDNDRRRASLGGIPS